jgi:hypothetical protein
MIALSYGHCKGDQIMTRKTFEITNDFHRTAVRIRAELGVELSPSQVYRARRALCGMSSCCCGGPLGERGPQAVRVEQVGYGNRIVLSSILDR